MGAVCTCLDGDGGAVVELKDAADAVASAPSEDGQRYSIAVKRKGDKTVFLDAMLQKHLLKGTLSDPAAREEFKQLFDKLDHDGSGNVDTEEFAEALAANGEMVHKFMGIASIDEIRNAFKRIDKDHNSTISFEEFVYASEIFSMSAQSGDSLSTEEGKQFVKDLFNKIDKNKGDGKITYQEFMRAMTANGLAMQELLGVQKLREETLRQAFDRFDLDKNQVITWDEFLKAAVKHLNGED